MPFERYLQSQDDRNIPTTSHPFLHQQHDYDGCSAPIPTTAIDVSIPHQFRMFNFTNLPTLAPGGGAEILPPAYVAPWLNNNGFVPKHFQGPLFQSSSKSCMADDAFDLQYPLPLSTTYGFNPTPPTDLCTSTAVAHTHVNDCASFAITTPSSQSFDPPPPEISPLTNDLAIARPVASRPAVLPVYSASGFDLLPILARVVNRPNPKINLGPVDLTCSFVVVDVRRYDSPIVYCSPTFCRLTGYEEHQVLGRNCRFLQSPNGSMEKGGHRQHDADAVAHLKRSLLADKECQTTLINYKKDGSSFVNHITIIPVMGKVSDSPHEPDQVVYHVGFQTDMTEVSNIFMQKLRDGSLNVTYNTSHIPLAMGLPGRDRKSHALRISPMSKILSSILMQPRFLQSIPITSCTTAPCSTSSDKMEVPEINQILNLILLETLPDFIHVVSLKGAFLYVAPSVRHVLGYEPEELVGKTIAEFCHQADLVPLMRELKESSVTQGQVQDTQRYPSPPKTIDILFRARTKAGDYVWVESRGRLHAEPGKGRKAIVLSGRSRGIPHLTWESIARTGGLTPAAPGVGSAGWSGLQRLEREFWGMLSSDGTILVVGAGIRDVLGWEVDEVIGKAIGFLVVGNNDLAQALQVNMSRASEQGSCETSQLLFLRTKKGSHVSGKVVLYPSFDRVPSVSSPCQVVCQIKLVDSSVLSPRFVTRFAHPLSASVFEELETSRSSSWQYELERLRFENQRLAEEIEMLEKKQIGVLPQTPLTSSFLDQRCHPSSSPSSSMHHVRQESQDIITPSRRMSSLKRSWDSRDVFPT